jgi:hypothetical protein
VAERARRGQAAASSLNRVCKACVQRGGARGGDQGKGGLGSLMSGASSLAAASLFEYALHSICGPRAQGVLRGLQM